MNIVDIINQSKKILQNKSYFSKYEPSPDKLGLEDVFSYSFGEPDDPLMKDCFTQLRELMRHDDTNKNHTDQPEPEKVDDEGGNF